MAQTPLWELIALPRPLARFWGGKMGKGKGKKDGKEEEETKGGRVEVRKKGREGAGKEEETILISFAPPNL